MKVTSVHFATSTNKWYLRIEQSHDIEISDDTARSIIRFYDLVETNLLVFKLQTHTPILSEI